MKLFAKLRSLFAQKPKNQNIEWFVVSFDDERIMRKVSPPGKQAWEDDLTWSSIIRVCFKCEDMWTSDGIYIFTSLRPESYVIPTEAVGGLELWNEILRRKLYDAELAINAMSSGL